MENNKATNLEIHEAIGYEAGQIAAAHLVGALRGFADGLESLGYSPLAEAAANVTEISTTPGDGQADEPEGKTRIEDCRACWCNTCANIEDCIDAPEGWQRGVLRPYPCADCADGRMYMPKNTTWASIPKSCPCAGYTPGGENYG